MKLFKITFLISVLSPLSIISYGQSTSRIVKLSIDDFEKKINASPNAQIIDVRTSGEFAAGHIAKAKNINWNDTSFETEIQKVDKSKPVYVYCLSGGRSDRAATKMSDMGFKEIYEMPGGMSAWDLNGKPVVTSEAPKK